MSRNERRTGETPAAHNAVMTPKAPKKKGASDHELHEWLKGRNTPFYDTHNSLASMSLNSTVAEEWSKHISPKKNCSLQTQPKGGVHKSHARKRLIFPEDYEFTYPQIPWTRELYSRNFSSRPHAEPEQNKLKLNRTFSTFKKFRPKENNNNSESNNNL